MSKRNPGKVILPRQTVGAGVTVTAPLHIEECTGVSFHVVWEGTPSVGIELQTSNDPQVDRQLDNSSWFTEPTTITGCDGSVTDGSIVKHVDNLNSSFVRLQFTATTAGTISVYATTKL